MLGCDVRLTSESLKLALAKGLQDSGTDVIDIGLTGTEEIYDVQLRTSEHRSMYSYVRLSIDRCTATYV